MSKGTAVLEHINFFNRVISELPTVDVKIDREDKTLILLSSLSQSYDHIIITGLFDKKILILEEVTSTLLSNEIEKGQIKRKDRIRFGGHGKKRKKRKERCGLVKGMQLLSQGKSLEE